ncbi:chitinase, partial [Lysobacter sp. 2RAB21]
MRYPRSANLLLLSGMLAASSFSTAFAQAACNGVPAWNASTIYNAGDKLTYQSHLYQANIQIWNTPPTHCPSCNYYADLGVCGT